MIFLKILKNNKKHRKAAKTKERKAITLCSSFPPNKQKGLCLVGWWWCLIINEISCYVSVQETFALIGISANVDLEPVTWGKVNCSGSIQLTKEESISVIHRIHERKSSLEKARGKKEVDEQKVLTA